MRYVEVTHTYVLPVPEEDTDPAELDPVMNAGVTMMEKFIHQHGTAIQELRSDWKMMPSEYSPPARPESEVTVTPAMQMSRADILRFQEGGVRHGQYFEPGQVSFVGDVMGQRPEAPGHPWDQGLRVLPLNHPSAAMETQALRAEGLLCGAITRSDRYGGPSLICFGVRGHERHGVDHTWVTATEEEAKGGPDRGDTGGAVEGSPRQLEAGPDGD